MQLHPHPNGDACSLKLLEASRAHQLCLEESHPRDDSDEDVHAMSSDDDSLGSDGSTDGEEKCCLQLLINL